MKKYNQVFKLRKTLKFIFLAQQNSKENILFLVVVRINRAYVKLFLVSPSWIFKFLVQVLRLLVCPRWKTRMSELGCPKTRMSAMTISSGTRDSKIHDAETVDGRRPEELLFRQKKWIFNSLFQVSKIKACTLKQSETIVLPFSFRFGGCGTYIKPENESEGILLCFGQSWRDQCFWTEDLESNQWTNIGRSQLYV